MGYLCPPSKRGPAPESAPFKKRPLVKGEGGGEGRGGGDVGGGDKIAHGVGERTRLGHLRLPAAAHGPAAAWCSRFQREEPGPLKSDLREGSTANVSCGLLLR